MKKLSKISIIISLIFSIVSNVSAAEADQCYQPGEVGYESNTQYQSEFCILRSNKDKPNANKITLEYLRTLPEKCNNETSDSVQALAITNNGERMVITTSNNCTYLINNRPFTSAASSVAHDIGHGNDITYNKNTGQIIIADGGGNPYLYVFNDSNIASSTSSPTTINLNTINSITGGFAIAYDDISNNYFYGWHKYINILDSSYKRTSRTSNINGLSCRTSQSFSVINGKLYYITIKKANNQNNCTQTDYYRDKYNVDDTIIHSFDRNGQWEKTYYIDAVYRNGGRLEIESMDVDEKTGIIYAVANNWKLSTNSYTDTKDNNKYYYVLTGNSSVNQERLIYKVNSKVNIRYYIDNGEIKDTTDTTVRISDNYLEKYDSTNNVWNKASHSLKYGSALTNTLYDANSKTGVNLERTGYKLDETKTWYLDYKNSDGTSTKKTYSQATDTYEAIDFCGPSLVDCTVNLKPNWIPVDYTITYNLNGGTVNENKTSYNVETTSFTLNNPTKKGYKFAGWSGTGINDKELEVTVEKGTTGNRTYTATWEPITYEITYNLDGGTVNENKTSYNIETASFTLNNPVKEGYTFTGWTGTGLSSKTKSVTVEKGSTGNKTYTANWEVNKVNIKYHINGGSLDTTSEAISTSGSYITLDGNEIVQTVNYGESLGPNGLANYNNSSYINIKKEGYTGKSEQEWNTKADGTGTSYKQGIQYEASDLCDATLASCTLTLYVNWTPVNYTITYNLNGGTVNENKTSYNVETASFTLNNPEKEGYTFTGWTGTGLSGKTKSVTVEKGSTGNRTYTANYDINKYTITFNSNGGSAVNEITQNYNTSVSEPANPTKQGYKFAGWYSDESLTNLYTFTTMPSKNITLYAKWTVNEKIITYELDGGINNSSNPTTYSPGEEKNLYNPTKKGYEFAGWYLDENYTNKVEKIESSFTKNITLYAKWTKEAYTITYNLNGGTVSENKTSYNVETASFTLNNPSKKGYTFTGWTGTGLSGKTKTVTVEKGSTGNRTYTANYDINKYTITFNSNGGSAVNEITQNYNTSVSEPTNPTKEGYKFTGWYIDESLTNKYEFKTMPSKNITLYAKWTKETYEITYNLNGGKVNENKTSYNVETTSFKLNNPVKEGYTFTGWTGTGLSSETKTVTIEQGSTGNRTYTANYDINKYTITFNSNGGSVVNEITQNYNTSVSEPTNPTKEGYKFTGWYIDESLTNKYEFKTMPSKNITLYAKWTKEAYTITYNLNGGAVNENKTSYNVETTSFTLNNPTKKYYKFTGWTGTGLSGKTKSVTVEKGSTGNRTYTANWEPITYEITYNLDGGTVNENKTSYNIETASFTLNNPEKEGYTFTGWTGTDLSVKTKSVTVEKGSTGNRTYTANYDINKYTITFNSNGGSAVNAITQNYNTSVSEPTKPTKEGYKFTGWYIDESLTNKYEFKAMPSKNITLYAKWTADEKIITYELDGGINNNSNPTTYLPGEEKNLYNPTKKGYEFAGWYLDENYTNKVEKIESSFTKNITLYAGWEKNLYTIKFETNEGEKLEDIQVGYNEKIIKPNDPNKKGHTFKDWYKDELLSEKYDFDLPVSKDMILYASWEENEYKVTYNTNGGTEISPVKVKYGSKINRPENPMKEGYTFIGWIDEDNKEFTFGNMDDHDITLYAAWEENEYTITFNSNGGSIVENIKVKYQEILQEPEKPVREGYKFTGWYQDEELTKQYSFTEMPSKDITLYAGWTKIKNVIRYELKDGENNGENPTTYKEGEEIELLIPKKRGSEFEGWYLEETYETKIDKITREMNSDITLYAKWKDIKYKITFETNGGSTVNEINASYEEKIEHPEDPVREGYTFTGWYKDTEQNEKYVFDTMTDEDIKLYAGWKKNIYTITFNSNEGSIVNGITAEYKTKIEEPNHPYKENYRFTGWYIDKELTKLYSFTEMPSKNITLYAGWVNNNYKIISYELNGGINDPNNITNYLEGEEKELLNPTKEGYKFLGWYSDPGFRTKVEKITKETKGDLTLYAKWEGDVLVVEVPKTKENIPLYITSIGLVLLIGSIATISYINKTKK